MNNERCLDFFEKRYHWSVKDIRNGTSHSLTLEEVTENEKEMIDANPDFYLKATEAT